MRPGLTWYKDLHSVQNSHCCTNKNGRKSVQLQNSRNSMHIRCIPIHRLHRSIFLSDNGYTRTYRSCFCTFQMHRRYKHCHQVQKIQCYICSLLQTGHHWTTNRSFSGILSNLRRSSSLVQSRSMWPPNSWCTVHYRMCLCISQWDTANMINRCLDSCMIQQDKQNIQGHICRNILRCICMLERMCCDSESSNWQCMQCKRPNRYYFCIFRHRTESTRHRLGRYTLHCTCKIRY